MLYRLRCPHCGSVEDHAFVRPGAVTVCAACHSIWRTEPAHIQRVATPRPAASPAPAAVETTPPPRPSSPGDSALHVSPDDTSLVGLSGLSDVMRGPDEPVLDDDAPVPIGRAATPTGDPPSPKAFRQQQAQSLAKRRAAEAAAKRRSRTTLVLLATLTVLVGSLGVAVALLATKPPAASDLPAVDPGLADPMLTNDTQVDEPAAIPTLSATPLDLRDPRLLAAARPGIRGVVELLPADAPDQLEPDQIAVRVSATPLSEAAVPGPIELLLTASYDGRLTAAWRLRDPRTLSPAVANRLIAQLDRFPDQADPKGWIVTPLQPDP